MKSYRYYYYDASCVNFAAARNESLAGSIVRTILSASMSLNNDVGYLQTKSASLSAEKIHQKLLEEAADGSDSNSSSSSGCSHVA